MTLRTKVCEFRARCQKEKLLQPPPVRTCKPCSRHNTCKGGLVRCTTWCSSFEINGPSPCRSARTRDHSDVLLRSCTRVSRRWPNCRDQSLTDHCSLMLLFFAGYRREVQWGTSKLWKAGLQLRNQQNVWMHLTSGCRHLGVSVVEFLHCSWGARPLRCRRNRPNSACFAKLSGVAAQSPRLISTSTRL
jgi:hypothetical protein